MKREIGNSGRPGKITSIGKLRGMEREMLKRELEEIDGVINGTYF